MGRGAPWARRAPAPALPLAGLARARFAGAGRRRARVPPRRRACRGRSAGSAPSPGCAPRAAHDPARRRSPPGGPEVVPDARREEVRVLPRDRDHSADVLLAIAAQILAGQGDASSLRVDEAQEQADDRGLAGAAPSDEYDASPRFEPEAEAVERRLLAGAVAGADVLELDRERRNERREGLRGIDDA